MTGVVLAAGPGRRLHPLTAALPKTLLPLAHGWTILDLVLSNLRSVGVEDVVVVTGFAAERVHERAHALERRHGVRLEIVVNARAEEWNNAYSLWLARDALANGAILVNGDTVHPASVEQALLAARAPHLLLAVDGAKLLGGEEMKVVLSADGTVRRIGKAIDPGSADGEYVGVALVEAQAAAELAQALEATWRRDPSLYYEDGYQELVERGWKVHAVPIGPVDWVEVDDHADLARARELASSIPPPDSQEGECPC
ncbi:MAG: sugar phosphate nucleotidyltransferase [Actinomycetota bacterium]|nr:sugar phosphate nucleotidyltransferase [Actinomycetota bacterium]